MSQETVDLLLSEALSEADPDAAVTFSFQGGEPTLAGLPFFREFVRKARRRCPNPDNLLFSIQTNGTLIDEEWAKFLAQEHFLVGISIDGYHDLHNLYRTDASGNGSWDQVMNGLRFLRKHAVDVNALCVVTGKCASAPAKVYRNLKKLGFRYIQFIACLDPIDAERGTMPYSLTPEAYGKFLCNLFDLWLDDWHGNDFHSIRLFEDYLCIIMKKPFSTCATCGKCGNYLVIEADGSVYPCDFYALDEWCLGKLGKQSLSEMAEGETMRRFLRFGQEKPAACADCMYDESCNGGCKNDWVLREDGFHNYYCKAFQIFFEHSIEQLNEIAENLLQHERQRLNSRY